MNSDQRKKTFRAASKKYTKKKANNGIPRFNTYLPEALVEPLTTFAVENGIHHSRGAKYGEPNLTEALFQLANDQLASLKNQ